MLLFSMAAGAQNVEVEINGIFYRLVSSSGQAQIISNPNKYSGKIDIPESVEYEDETYSVSSIGSAAFSDCSALYSVVIPNSVKMIGTNAFSGCYSLTSVTFPNSVTTISDRAFYGCTGLTSINIPNSVRQIHPSSFSGCDNLITIKVENDNTVYDSRDNCNAIIKTQTNTLISGCKNTIIPHSVTAIGEEAFLSCNSLTSITIPNSVTSIGKRAFYGCKNLTSITIPSSVISLGEYLFYNCENLTTIVVENNNIVYDSRDDCNAIINTQTNTLILGCKNSKIPNTVTTIGDGAFFGISSLTSIVFPYNVNQIGRSAFAGCRLENVVARNLNVYFYHSWKDHPHDTYGNNAFSYATINHAVLYIPIGTWSEAIYGGGYWYNFINIREMAMAQDEISYKSAYTLMNQNNFTYAVYDAVNDKVVMVSSRYRIDESNPNHCWQVVENDGRKFLYNIGAKKYANVAEDGTIKLQETPVSVSMNNQANGIQMGDDQQGQWNFVVNNNVSIDESITAVENPMTEQNFTQQYFSLDGKRISEPKKGVNILRFSNGKVKKVVVK